MAFCTIANKGGFLQWDDSVTGACVRYTQFCEEYHGLDIELMIWLVYCRDYDRNIIAVLDDGQRL